jgi:GntP family gluconate:H+ symporter
MVTRMLLATILLPLVLAFVIVAVQRFDLPAWFALTAAALGYGLLADRQLHAFGRAFSLGFASAIEQVGLLVIVGGVLGIALRGRALPPVPAAASGVAAGMMVPAAAGLGLLHGAFAGAPRRGLLAVMLALAAQAVMLPSPVAVAAAWVTRADLGHMMALGTPMALLAAMGAWRALRPRVCADSPLAFEATGSEESASMKRETAAIWWILPILLGIMLVFALAQVPSEPLGKRAADLMVTNLGRPFVVAAVGLTLAFVASRYVRAAAHDTTPWAPLLLTVGASGGLSFVLNETGAPELLAETWLDARLGLLVPFLTAATVKTMQGSSLTAVLTAVGMTEPMLASLGLDSSSGRLLAAGAAGAGSIALCHVNDPLFWIGAHMLRLPPARALAVIGGGSAFVAIVMLVLVVMLRVVLE